MSGEILFIDSAGGGGGAGDTPTARPSTGSTRPRTSGGGRPRTGGAGRRKQASPFRSAVDRNSLPLRLEARPSGRRIILWEVDCGGPEAAALLPLLVSGLAERDEPYNVVAAEATIDVLENIGGGVVAMLDDIVPALKTALNTRDSAVLTSVLRVLRQLCAAHESVGPALVPHYKALLPSFNIHLAKRAARVSSTSDLEAHDPEAELGDAIAQTLEEMELAGGAPATAALGLVVPAHKSCFVAPM